MSLKYTKYAINDGGDWDSSFVGDVVVHLRVSRNDSYNNVENLQCRDFNVDLMEVERLKDLENQVEN